MSFTESAEVFVARMQSLATTRSKLSEDLTLHREILDDRLGYQIAARQIGQLGGDAKGGERPIALRGRQTLTFDTLLEAHRYLGAGAISEIGSDLMDDRVDAGLDKKLLHPRSHRPEPDDPRRPNSSHDLRRRGTGSGGAREALRSGRRLSIRMTRSP